jgi:protein-disulfide isomerase
MHGIDELTENLRQLCVWRDQQDTWVDYVNYVNTTCSLQDINECWKDAAQVAGVDTDAVESCVETDGLALAAAEKALSDEKGVQGSPSMFINDTKYEGYRTSEAFKAAVCSAFNTEPEECSTTLSEEAAVASGGCGA